MWGEGFTGLGWAKAQHRPRQTGWQTDRVPDSAHISMRHGRGHADLRRCPNEQRGRAAALEQNQKHGEVLMGHTKVVQRDTDWTENGTLIFRVIRLDEK